MCPLAVDLLRVSLIVSAKGRGMLEGVSKVRDRTKSLCGANAVAVGKLKCVSVCALQD